MGLIDFAKSAGAPSLDSVQEFKVQSGNHSSEYASRKGQVRLSQTLFTASREPTSRLASLGKS